MHITGTLNEIDQTKDLNESLLQTIKMPRNLVQISNIMPAARYKPNEDPRDKVLKHLSPIKAV